MAIVEKRPLTPSQRFRVQNKPDSISKKRPEKSLTSSKKRSGGRNVYGRITSRRRGGGHKKLYRQVDFRRNKLDVPAKVEAIEYDPNRSANIALLVYEDGEKRYIVAPTRLKVGDTVISSNGRVDYQPGNNMPLSEMPPTARVHCVELDPNTKAALARGAGVSAQIVSIEGKFATLRMPSGELRLVNKKCRATLGEVGNTNHRNEMLGKAGRTRWKGRRPRVRGMAMNPVDHPNGGGEGRSKSGGGRQHPMSPWGQLSKSFPTRARSKTTDKYILVRRNGRKVK